MIGVEEACLRAKEHAGAIAHMNEADRNAVLTAAARALREHAPQIIAENRKDCEACTRGAQFVDRLRLDEKRIDDIHALKNEAVKDQNFELAADYRDQEANLQEELNRLALSLLEESVPEAEN